MTANHFSFEINIYGQEANPVLNQSKVELKKY